MYVRNEAQLFLRNNALGYPSFFRLTQQKHIPAHDELEHLRSMFGVTFPPLPSVGLGKPIYDHGGFRFGVLICSELSNAEHRVVFRGNVDTVFVLCWNQDLESFESMLDAAALDIHSYQVLVSQSVGTETVASELHSKTVGVGTLCESKAASKIMSSWQNWTSQNSGIFKAITNRQRMVCSSRCPGICDDAPTEKWCRLQNREQWRHSLWIR